MSYLDILPKELRNELELYTNYIFWLWLNRLNKHNYISKYGFEKEDRKDLKKYISPLYEQLGIPYKLIYKITQYDDKNLLTEFYYDIPNTHLITFNDLLYFLNNNTSARYPYTINNIVDINQNLKSFGFPYEIVRKYIAENRRINDKY